MQGVVYATDAASAIKAFYREVHYRQEAAVYRRIRNRRITSVCGFTVPTPLYRSDSLLVIEMGLVRPPFLLDSASAGLDGPLYEHTPEALAEWEESRREMFEGKWPLVRGVIAECRSHGIYLSDVKLGNIAFAD